MNKLALSVVVLMVAGAGVSMSSVGCSSSSSTGTSEDSGTGSDVTTGDDGGGTDSGTPTGDSGTPTGDSGTAADSGTAPCDVDAAGSIQVISTTADGGEVENTACEMCIATSCAQEQCTCLTDTNMGSVDDAAAPECAVYAICVYETFLTALATDDAGSAADLTNAQASCATSTSAPSSSTALGNGLIGCIATSCATQCVQ
jgi:hypothetical protein